METIVLLCYTLSMKNKTQHVFGPVPSRRLGRSIGINNIPPKVCSYACVYCQLGRAIDMRIERSAFYTPEDLTREVGEKLSHLSKGESVDYLTFVPDGEPTLDRNLGASIAALKQFKIPVALITNSSLLGDPTLREELQQLDWISLKVDSVHQDTWRRVDRPHKDIEFKKMLQGMITFSENFEGKLTTETMLIDGVNATEAEIEGVADFLDKIEPDISYVAVPTRPPAEGWVRPGSEEMIGYAYNHFAERVPHVELLIGYEGNAFSHSGDAVNDILSITAVHPMRRDAMKELLANDDEDWNVVEQLIDGGQLLEAEFGGHTYYLRRFRDKQMGKR